MQIAVFITCLTDTLFPQAGRATVRVLERLGHELVFPEDQTCCGQMHFNTGYREEGRALARRFERVFADAELVVSPSASCTAMVREHCSPEVGERVFELSELLVKRLGVEDVGAHYPHRVTYHPTCHGLRGLRLGDAPLRLLHAVRGLELVELAEAEECCGFGGTFAVKNADTSAAMLADKLRHIAETGADVSAAMLTDKMRHIVDTGAAVCTAGDASCLMHIGGGLSRAGGSVRTVHLAEILASTAEEQFA